MYSCYSHKRAPTPISAIVKFSVGGLVNYSSQHLIVVDQNAFIINDKLDINYIV